MIMNGIYVYEVFFKKIEYCKIEVIFVKMWNVKCVKNNLWKRPLKKIMDGMKAKLLSNVLCLSPN
jgi:hypothetical protein